MSRRSSLWTSQGPPATSLTAIHDPQRRWTPRRSVSLRIWTGRCERDASAVFQRKVLEKCAEIPPGEIRPYGWIAREIGNPGAVRAVGTALGRNPVPVLIPCHRVVRTDGKIGNYAYGSPMKRSLLEREGLDPDEIEALAGRGVRLIGSDTTGIYCYPTCRHARRIRDVHRVEFRTESDAEAAGFRPCKICRPAAA